MKLIGFKNILIAACLLPLTANAEPRTYLAKGMFSLTQRDLPKSFTKKKTRVVEGCGPVAVAMVLGYWQTDKNEGRLLVNNNTFRGQLLDSDGKVTNERPAKDIQRIYKALKTYKVPRSHMSYTPTKDLYKGLAKLVQSRKLRVKFLSYKKKWSTRKRAIKRALKRGEPVIVRKEKEHKDGCIGTESGGGNIIKNAFQDHYYVLAGYRGNKVAVLPGGGDRNRGDMTNWKTYSESRRRNTQRVCTFKELEKDAVSVITLSRSKKRYCYENSHCGKGNYCHKKKKKFLEYSCRKKKRKGVKCSGKHQCASGKCSWGKCK